MLSEYQRQLGASIREAEVVQLDVLAGGDRILPREGLGPFVTYVKVSSAQDDEYSFTIIMMVSNLLNICSYRAAYNYITLHGNC